MAQLGEGTIELKLGEETVRLKPTLFAAQLISRQGGGIMGAVDRCLHLDIDTIVQVITVGMGYGTTSKPPKDIAEKIFSAGLSDDSGGVVETCVRYLRVLANGGRLPKEATEGAGGTTSDRDPP